MYYLNNFLLYSIFGFIFENFICIIFNNNMESGIMYGPFTPVYGIGVLTILLINSKLKYKKKYKNIIMLFIFSIIVLSIIEYIGGIIIKSIFKTTLWNYKSLPLHIGKYISLEISLIWGISSIIYIYLLKPISDRIVSIIPKFITYSLAVVFIIDFLITVINKQKIF